ncbi:hypothetical protein CQW23_13209 [Capsicum baccatum]|uniref:Uncharacterized protein n=1 Tax=Capsicum baccatum TaxID=33114 RepID=A0A2G2WUX8_CAPBA|nr:hypothetical protein CQW23_13209 [Capsicum baccatum]
MLRPEESWELLEKRIFEEEHCPNELKDVGEKIAQKCDGLPLTVIYDKYIHSADSSFFSPEKRNPCAKHLLSLKIQFGYYLYNWHLIHLRLLKRLDVLGITLSEPSLVLSPTIWSLAKLRHVDIANCLVFDSDIDKLAKLENLKSLMFLELSCSVDSRDIFKKFPNLRNLDFRMDCSAAEQMYFPRLDVLNKLERVYALFDCSGHLTHVHQFDFHFPLSLKEVELIGFNLSSDELSGIGRSLPNLQKLELWNASIEGGKEWNMEQVTFRNLKSLILFKVFFSEWQVIADESFPVLEELYIQFCSELIEIPESFEDIASLKSIVVWGWRQLKESAIKIKKYVEEMTGEDKLEVELGSA